IRTTAATQGLLNNGSNLTLERGAIVGQETLGSINTGTATGLLYFPTGSSTTLTAGSSGTTWKGLSAGSQPNQEATMNIGTLSVTSDFILQGLGSRLRMGPKNTFAQHDPTLRMRIAAATPVTAQVIGPAGV